MNKDYKTLYTGTIIGGDTLIGHLLGHSLNAREFFGMTHGQHSSRMLGLDDRFPRYVQRTARAVDETFGPAQTYGYSSNVLRHKPILFRDEERGKYGPHWPNHNTDFGGFHNDFKRTDTIEMDEENQVRTWITYWNWMLRDAAITYLYKLENLASKAYEIPEEKEMEASNLNYIIMRLYDLHSQFEKEQQEHYRKQVETPQWKIDWLVERGWLLMAVSEEKGVTMSFKRHDAGKNAPETVVNGRTIKEVAEELFILVSSEEYAKEKAERELKLESA